MKARNNTMEINPGLLDFTKHLVPISDFSRGKTAQLFDDVKNNNTEYVVLKNNQPTAMLISLDMYSALVEKASKMEKLLEGLEEERLLKLAENRTAAANDSEYIDNNTLCKKLGINADEIENDYESVEIE